MSINLSKAKTNEIELQKGKNCAIIKMEFEKRGENRMKQHASNWLTKTWAVALVAFLCSALWGSAFSGVKIGYTLLKIEASDWASQLVFAGARFFLAGCMAFLMGSAAQRKLLLPSVQAMPKILIISCFQTILQYLFYYIGLAHTTGVNAAIIVAANVFAAILIASLLFRIEKLTAAKVIGCIIGFSGILLVHCSGLQGGMHLNLLGDGFIFLCTIASGFSSVFMKKYSAQENPVLLSSWQFCLGGLVMGVVGLLFGGSIQLVTPAAWGILLYLAFVSAAAYSMWALLLKYNPVSKVTVFGFLNPICGVVLSGIFLKETSSFGILGMLALVLVCVGIFIVNRCRES